MKWNDKPIYTSPMWTDFYKFAMGQFIFHRYPDIKVKFGLINRTKKIQLGKVIDVGELREHLDHVRSLRFNNSDLHYLRGTNEYESRMFQEDYLEFLREFKFPEYNLESYNGNLILEVEDSWKSSTYWEIPKMVIIKTLYTRAFMKDRTKFGQELIYAEGRKRLGQKINMLLEYPGVRFSEFGTRRAFNPEWQDYVVGVLTEEMPKTQFLGTSNVFLAMKYGLMPMGTNAHELPMVVGGLFNSSKEMFVQGQKFLINEWWEEYGHGLSMFLPDTFGSNFLLDILSKQQAQDWKGMRQDSGDPFHIVDMYINFYKKQGIDPNSKLILPSDGLTVPSMIDLHKEFEWEKSPRPKENKTKLSFGWGTNATDDLGGPESISIVSKAISANGIGLVKLSDNIEKALGTPEDVKRIKDYVGYSDTFREVCTY